jgi:hypothetical protein
MQSGAMTQDRASVSSRRRFESGLAQRKCTGDLSAPLREFRFHEKLFAAERGVAFCPGAHFGIGGALEKSLSLRRSSGRIQQSGQPPAARRDLLREPAPFGELPAVLKDKERIFRLIRVSEKSGKLEKSRWRRIVIDRREEVFTGEGKFVSSFGLSGQTKETLCDKIGNRRAACSRDHTCSPGWREASG